MTRVVLGSASSGRLSVLRNAGVDPLVIVSGVDEDAVIAALPDATPVAVVGALAEAKADEVVTRLPEEVAADCVVIGCDSMLLLDGRLCGKPGTAEAAQSQWRAMAGRSGELLTGHCLIRIVDGRVHSRCTETGSTTVHFGTPSAADLDAYIDHGEPLGVAGGFTLDQRRALAAADDLLRTDLLPAVHQLQESHGASSTPGVPWWMWLLPVLAWLTVVAIVGVSWYTAQLSHRVVNLGLAVAAAATIVLATSAGNLVASHNAGTAGSVAAEFGTVQSLTAGQRSGMDAVARLAGGVATRSWTADDASAYAADIEDAAERLGGQPYDDATAALQVLTQANEPVARAAAAKDWAEAATLLQKSSAKDPTPAADAFLEVTVASVDQGLTEVRAAADAQAAQTTTFAVAALVCALISALAGAFGLGQRLKEYR